ncbi:hypothetical protein [Oceanomicrobium pacificus]|uniref:Uncharacterized protein n=1 Tax=Oceanomicrobium pacificus TaxID=2692916 RepID=A0A6B0TX93_9RHOB|nr:hypothetical protein [Oceanomicrobium pacificus]MXU65912.1 hypothetical protein [Oceanomicrobium pacificus]
MEDAWDIIVEGRAIVASGGRLFSKGSNRVPTRLRQAFIARIDREIAVTLTSQAARQADTADVVVEHVIPIKRIVIEVIAPEAHDPRTGGRAMTRLGPARDLAHAERIAREMLTKAYVTRAEHDRLNIASQSFQWDAPAGDGMARYRVAGIELTAI